MTATMVTRTTTAFPFKRIIVLRNATYATETETLDGMLTIVVSWAFKKATSSSHTYQEDHLIYTEREGLFILPSRPKPPGLIGSRQVGL